MLFQLILTNKRAFISLVQSTLPRKTHYFIVNNEWICLFAGLSTLWGDFCDVVKSAGRRVYFSRGQLSYGRDYFM